MAWAVLPILRVQHFDKHCVLKESSGLGGMLRKPPKKVVDLAVYKRSDKCTGGSESFQRVKVTPTTFLNHLFWDITEEAWHDQAASSPERRSCGCLLQ